jgi:predicted transcriptional regulator
MLEQLFGSRTRVKLLGLFLRYPRDPMFVRELTRKIDTQINGVRRELANLLKVGADHRNRVQRRGGPRGAWALKRRLASSESTT